MTQLTAAVTQLTAAVTQLIANHTVTMVVTMIVTTILAKAESWGGTGGRTFPKIARQQTKL